MRQITAVLLLLSFFMLTGCSSIQVTYDYDKQADFKKYKTYQFYGWAKDSDKLLNDFNKKRFEAATANELEKRGLDYVTQDGDLMISLFIVVDQKTGVTAYTDHYGTGPYGPYRYGPGWGWGYGYTSTTYHEYDYLVGTLVIDIFDNKTKELVWQGVGSKTLAENPGNTEKKINNALAEIMYYYPVKPAQGK